MLIVFNSQVAECENELCGFLNYDTGPIGLVANWMLSFGEAERFIAEHGLRKLRIS